MSVLPRSMRPLASALLALPLVVAALSVASPTLAEDALPWRQAQKADPYEDRYDVYRETPRGNAGASRAYQDYRDAPPPAEPPRYDPRTDGPPQTEAERYERQPAAPPTYGAPYDAPDGGNGREAQDRSYPAPRSDGPRGEPGRRYAGPEEPAYERREPDPGYGREEYRDVPPPRSPAAYEQGEIVRAGHSLFGSVSKGLASAIEYTFQNVGRPNGYILGEDAGGAIVAGLRYGEGRLYTRDAGEHKVYWQGPTVGYDFGAEGSKVMVLVYNMRDPSDIYERFGGVQGAAYLIGGISVQLQKHGDVTLALIRSGLGVRLGANVGYLKYTRNPTWNPF